jgi:hypothetical protein
VKWDTNWLRKYWKFAGEYGVEKNKIEKHESKKTPFHATLLENGLNVFKFGTILVCMVIVQPHSIVSLNFKAIHPPTLLSEQGGGWVAEVSKALFLG